MSSSPDCNRGNQAAVDQARRSLLEVAAAMERTRERCSRIAAAIPCRVQSRTGLCYELVPYTPLEWIRCVADLVASEDSNPPSGVSMAQLIRRLALYTHQDLFSQWCEQYGLEPPFVDQGPVDGRATAIESALEESAFDLALCHTALAIRDTLELGHARPRKTLAGVVLLALCHEARSRCLGDPRNRIGDGWAVIREVQEELPQEALAGDSPAVALFEDLSRRCDVSLAMNEGKPIGETRLTLGLPLREVRRRALVALKEFRRP